MPRFLVITVFGALLCLASTACGAETVAPADAVAPIVSTAEDMPEEVLEEMVIRGKRDHTVTAYGTRFDLVGEEELERGSRDPGANVFTVLGALPGVNYRRAGLLANGLSGNPPAYFRIRGVGGVPNDGLLVLVNGRPQYVGVWGHSLPDAHRLGAVQHIEVSKGPASVQFGSQAFGGVVNIVTEKAGPGVSLQSVGGSDGTFGFFADVSREHGPLSWRLAASRSGTDGYRGGDQADIDGLRADLDWRLGDRWTLGLRGDGTETAFADPGSEAGFAPVAPGAMGDIRQRAIDLSLDGAGDDWTARLLLFHNYVHNDVIDAGNTKSSDFGMRLFGEKRGRRYGLKAGFDLERYGGNFTVNGNPFFPEMDRYDVNTAPYLLGNFALRETVGLAAGLRVNFSDRYDTEIVPQARLRLDVGERTTTTFSASRGFKTPSIAQQYLPFYAGNDTLLEPEVLWQYEATMSHDRDSWTTTLAIYHAEGDNLIRRAGSSWPPVYGNSGAFRHQGVEGSLQLRLGDNAGLSTALTWMLRRDEQTLGTPAGMATLGAWLRPTETLMFDLTLEGETDRYGADGETSPLDDLVLLSAGVDWTLPWPICPCSETEVDLFATVHNLTDEQYRIVSGYPMPGRTWSIGLRLTR